jgi:hypothetical protein
MADNFAQSAVRHWSDAVTLEGAGRTDNADQLFGFAAECGIKSALVEYPAIYKDGAIDERYKKHINELWSRVALQSLHKRFPALLAVLRLGNPFHDWSTSQRYGSDKAIATEALERHKNYAKRILGSVGLLGSRGER